MAATFKFNDETLKMVESLKAQFGAASNEEAIQKALVLAKFTADKADADSNVVISSSAGGNTTLNLKS